MNLVGFSLPLLDEYDRLTSGKSNRITVTDKKRPISKKCAETTQLQAENLRLAGENAELREFLEQYRGIVELSPDGIITLDLEGRILTCNRAFLNLSGYSKEEILNRHVGSLPAFAREDFPGYLRIFKLLMRSRKPTRFEFTWVHKSGALRTAEAHIGFLKKAGRVVGVQAFLRDITMRIEVERALRESEQWERSLFEGSLDAIFIADRSGRIVEVNPAAEVLTGYGRKELVRMFIPNLHAPEDLGPYQEFFNRIMKGEDITSVAKILKKDGTKVETEFSNRRIKAGGEIYMHAIARDITERKRTERKATQLGQIIDKSVNEVYIFDAESLKFVLVNRGARENLGYSMDELRNLTPLDLKPEFSLESFSRKIKPLRSGRKRSLEFFTSHRRKDGSMYPVEVFLQYAEFNLRPAFAAVILDITERKQAESAIFESEQKYRALFEYANDAIFLLDFNGRYVSANQKAAELLGYTQEELCNKSIFDSISSGDLAASKKALESITSGKLLPLYERRFVRKDGSEFPVEINNALIRDARNHPVLIQSIVRDITERKKAEEKNRKSLREKEVLLQEVHHRVKNNMQIISSLLRLQSSGVRDPELQSRFQETQNRILSMALIHEKLYQSTDYSRINFGDYLRDLLSNLLKTYEIEPKKVKALLRLEDIHVDINTAIPCGLIVNELVSNVLKHAFPQDRSGSLEIALCSAGPLKVELIVSDDGIGLPNDFDSDSTRSLGLQLVKQLVRQLDAEIHLNSNNGTQIRLVFPLPH